MEFKREDWVQSWSGPFSLIGASMDAVQQRKSNNLILGKGFNESLIFYKKGITSCYLLKEDLKKYELQLTALVVENPNLILQWSEELVNKGDALLHALENIKENLKEVKLTHDEFQPYQYINKSLGDALPNELIKKFDILKQARRKTEHIYPKLTEVAINTIAEIAPNIPKKVHGAILFDEFESMFVKKIPPLSVLERRDRGVVLHFVDDKLVAEYDYDEISKQFKADGKLVGSCACPGIVKGRCRIVRRPSDTFLDGEILVTGMTTPDMVPLMKRASAIVTDAGGALCHAAIVSRELGVPCIVGTQVATNTFRDGEVLLVDAEKGVVKRVERS